MTDKVQSAEASQWKNLEAQTGKTQAQWLALANQQAFAKHGELVAWLKAEHQIGHGYANLIAIRAREAAAGGAASEDDLVTAQYAGNKAALKPIYETMLAFVQTLGKDVEISPKKSYVSLRRSKQFALIQPSTASRLDLGLNLKGVEPSGKLEASGSFNAMCTHRVRLESAADFTAEVKGWLKQAYQEA